MLENTRHYLSSNKYAVTSATPHNFAEASATMPPILLQVQRQSVA